MQYQGHTLRHELKYYINASVYHTLRNRLRVVLKPDPNMKREDGYLISSLYFDDLHHSALNEKQSGIRFRKKYRMRCYDRSDALIKLECKYKYDEYISKTSATLSRAEYDAILRNDYGLLASRREEVCRQLLAYHNLRLLQPVVAVEYLREAYVLPQGNVRITFDKDISASTDCFDMFAEDYVTSRVLEKDLIVLEVKYDDFIPSFVLEILQTAMTNKCAISKYVMCRVDKRRILYR